MQLIPTPWPVVVYTPYTREQEIAQIRQNQLAQLAYNTRERDVQFIIAWLTHELSLEIFDLVNAFVDPEYFEVYIHLE